VSDAPLFTCDSLVEAIDTFLAGHDPQMLAEIRGALARDIDAAGPDALVTLSERLATDGGDWSYYPPDPLARRIHHLLADRILQPGSGLVGMEHLTAAPDRQIVIFSNHLSYSDANCLEVLLYRAGSPLSDMLTAIAGPKVYSSLKRRFSSLCFGTIKTPQSSTLSTEDAVMNRGTWPARLDARSKSRTNAFAPATPCSCSPKGRAAAVMACSRC